jgi:putative transposase
MSKSHRKKLKRVHEPGHFHELTFSCYQGKPLLTNNPWRLELSQHIDDACRKNQLDLHAFVFMPNHVHLLVYPRPGDPDIPGFLAQFKTRFSRTIKQMLQDNGSRLLQDLTVLERPGKYCFRFWQEGGGYDRNLFDPKTIEAAITYIHMNPVRKNLCTNAVDWKWSSARWYLTGETDEDVPQLQVLPAEVFNPGGVQIPNL